LTPIDRFAGTFDGFVVLWQIAKAIPEPSLGADISLEMG
jgi:hypothetical protein